MIAASPTSHSSPAGLLGRGVALLASGLQILAAFLPWDAAGTLALDASLQGFQPGVEQPTVASSLVALAALPALAALVVDSGWPRLLSGVGTAALVVLWLVAGPTGLPAGVVAAIVAAAGHLVAAALAVGSPPAESAPGGGQPAAPGFRQLSHTADVAFEAWGPSRAACFGQAVRALVAAFAEVETAAVSARHAVEFGPDDDDEDLLVDLLDEVVYVLDVDGAVPVGGELHDQPNGGLRGHFDLAAVDSVRPSGAVPKAITYHDLLVEATTDGWRCRVTVDV